MLRNLAAVALVLVAVAPVSAQFVNYADFSNVSTMALNANATQAGVDLRVAPAGNMSKGSAYHATPLEVTNGFDTTFAFRITNVGTSGGSGMTFVIHADPALTAAIGDHAWAMGYAEFNANPGNGLNDSLVLELDCFQDTGHGDPSHSHLSLHTNGSGDNRAQESFSLGSWSTPTDMADGMIHTIQIVYTPGTLDVYYDGSAAPVISVAYDFATGGTFAAGGTVGGLNLLPGGTAVVGFTASMPTVSSGQQQDHDVLSWTFASTASPSYPGNGADVDLAVEINGAASTGTGGVHTIAPTDLVTFYITSPGGTLVGQPFVLAATGFATGMPPAGFSLLGGQPDVWVGYPNNVLYLVDGIFTPGPTVPGGGYAAGPYPVPPALTGGGISYMMQVGVIAPGFNAVNIGLSDGNELQFQ